MSRIEARYYEKLDEERVRCLLCPHHCLLREGQKGICRVRVNEAGKLFTLNYEEVVSLALDPIEKKPLFHFYPGKLILSAGTFGCNFSCAFCQNYLLAQENPGSRRIDSDTMVEIALKTKEEGSIGLAFTYNEPSIWYEYVLETAKKLKENDLQVVLVTNGYIDKAPLEELLPCVDAMNIDLKAFSDSFYSRLCKGKLEAVKATIERAVGMTHVEITTLIIPGENDNMKEITAMARWISSLNPEIPLHLSRYHPAYRLEKSATPIQTLQEAQNLAREFLDFVYTGNIAEENKTICKECGQTLIKRSVYHTQICGLQENRCINCGNLINSIVT